jgi:hypothetical protein
VKRWLVVLLIFVAGTAAGGGIVWAVSRGDDGPSKLATTATKKAGVSAPAQELLDRLAIGEKGTYHVRYTYSGNSGTSAAMEIWRKAERVRRDLIVVSPIEGTARTEEILDNGKLVRCLLLADHPWQCTGVDVRSAGALRDPANGVNHDVAGKTVEVTTEQIAGHDAKCYSITPPSTATSVASKPVQFCFSAESVPLRIDGGDGKPVSATNFDLTVPDSVFTPPAPVAGSQAA